MTNQFIELRDSIEEQYAKLLWQLYEEYADADRILNGLNPKVFTDAHKDLIKTMHPHLDDSLREGTRYPSFTHSLMCAEFAGMLLPAEHIDRDATIEACIVHDAISKGKFGRDVDGEFRIITNWPKLSNGLYERASDSAIILKEPIGLPYQVNDIYAKKNIQRYTRVNQVRLWGKPWHRVAILCDASHNLVDSKHLDGWLKRDDIQARHLGFLDQILNKLDFDENINSPVRELMHYVNTTENIGNGCIAKHSEQYEMIDKRLSKRSEQCSIKHLTKHGYSKSVLRQYMSILAQRQKKKLNT